MSQLYRIEKVPSDDYEIEAIVEGLHEACWDRTFWDATADWWLARNTATDEPVGFGGLRWSKRERGGFLVRGGVHPLARGNGLQRMLIKARVQFAKKQGLDFCVSNTIPGNHYSANNLIEEGFRLYDPIAPWGDTGDAYWRKELH